MKWSDIRNKITSSKSVDTEKQVREKTDLPIQGQARENQKRFLAIGIILVIIIAIVTIFFVMQNRKRDAQFLTKDQAEFVSGFLDENPPTPITDEESSFMQDLLITGFSDDTE